MGIVKANIAYILNDMTAMANKERVSLKSKTAQTVYAEEKQVKVEVEQ